MNQVHHLHALSKRMDLPGRIPTSIEYLDHTEGPFAVKAPHWSLAKYENQEHFDLSGLSKNGLDALSREFGIRLNPRLPKPSAVKDGNGETRRTHFLESPAFVGLCEWAKKHPRLYKQYYENSAAYTAWREAVAKVLDVE
jgi:hypothetical protein